MATSFSVTVSVTPIPARRRAFWSPDDKQLVLEPLQPLDYKQKAIPPLEAFRRLWRALEGGAPNGFTRFRETIPSVVAKAGCLAPHPPLLEPSCVAGLIEVEPHSWWDDINSWLEAAVRAHLWVAALGADGTKITNFVELWLRSIHQHAGLPGEAWRRHYRLLFAEGGEVLTLPLDAPLNAAARLVAAHRGRRLLSARLIRQHLRAEGMRGLLLPPVVPSPGASVVAEVGLYHLSLLRLSRSLGLRTCAVCGTLFQPQRSTARFCSARCRTAAYRAGG